MKPLSQNYGKSLNIKEQLLNKVENFVTKVEISHNEQFPFFCGPKKTFKLK